MKKVSLVLIFLITRLHGQILIPFMPDVTWNGGTGYVKTFYFDSTTNKLYIAGDFNYVGNTHRDGLAVIDITNGNVLPDFAYMQITNQPDVHYAPFYNTVMKMLRYHNKIYIGGVYISMDTTSSLVGGPLIYLDLTNNSANTVPTANYGISDFQVYNDKIYFAGSYQVGYAEEYYVTESDTLGNVLWQKSISSNSGDELNCLTIRNNNLFIGGIFSTFNGINQKNISRTDLATHTTSLSSWTLTPAPTSTATPNCFGVSDIVAYPNNILVSFNNSACSSPNSVAFYDINSANLNSNLRQLNYEASFKRALAENDTSFWYYEGGSLHLYGVQNYIYPWSPNANSSIDYFYRSNNYLFVGGGFSTLEGSPRSGLGVYCMTPEIPVLQLSTSSVCRLQTGVTYSVKPNYKVSNYTWSYTGTGVTINGSGTNVMLDFSATGTSGNLNVFATNDCGAVSPVLTIPITVNTLPNDNAGADVIFSCMHQSDSLKGSSSTVNVSYNWSGPSAYSSTNAANQILSGIAPGIYTLTVTNNITGCASKDTTKISYDTLRPSINHLSGTYALDCQITSVTLDASSNYPVSDTLFWTAPLGQLNPVNVNAAGIYHLLITNTLNGCTNTDSVTVTNNSNPPSVSVLVMKDTITCLKDSVQLLATTGSANAALFWTNSPDTLQNNSYVTQSGIYFAHALDTTNGCVGTSANNLQVTTFTTLPSVQIIPGNYQINCSYSVDTLKGSSLNAGATLQWSGAGGFSSVNPAAVNSPGWYVLTVTHPQNGCTAKDSVDVTLQNVLALNVSPSTNICSGSAATLSVNPIGGTPGFTYSWSNGTNSSNTSVSPADTTTYYITVTDNAGCVGKDSVIIKVPAPVSDSLSTFIPCDPNHPNGQIQAFASGGIVPYTYSLNGGMYMSSGVFSNLNFGTYTVSVRDGWGCNFVSTATIDSNSILPAPDFILATNEIKGDTFVLVDISNPRPDSVSWILPQGCVMINNDMFAPQIVNSDTGALQITMNAWFGTCSMTLTKNIHVVKPDTSIASDHNNNGIKNITLYPNPNSGVFTADIEFYKAQDFIVLIYDAAVHEVLRYTYHKKDFVSIPFNLSGSSPGTYLLKIISEYDSATRSFLISN